MSTRQKRDRRERLKGLLVGGSYFTCMGIFALFQMDGVAFLTAFPFGVAVGLVLLYIWYLEYTKRYQQKTLRSPEGIGLAASFLLGLLVVFGLPGLRDASVYVHSYVAGASIGFLLTIAFGAALIVYRYK